MKVKSPAYLYSEDSLQRLRNNIYFAPINSKYKHMIRNMIKLLALHGIYYEAPSDAPAHEKHGVMINTERTPRTMKRREKRAAELRDYWHRQAQVYTQARVTEMERQQQEVTPFERRVVDGTPIPRFDYHRHTVRWVDNDGDMHELCGTEPGDAPVDRPEPAESDDSICNF